MQADLAPSLALLLHEGGWDEILMVAVGLGIAYLVIVWTGRRNDDDVDEEVEDDDTAERGPPESPHNQAPDRRL